MGRSLRRSLVLAVAAQVGVACLPADDATGVPEDADDAAQLPDGEGCTAVVCDAACRTAGLLGVCRGELCVCVPPGPAEDGGADVPPLEDVLLVEDDGGTIPPPGEPDTSALGDTPYFTTGASLCDYVNEARDLSSGHERYRGGADAGYHTTRTWPIRLTVDAGLMAEAREEALRIAGVGSAPGMRHGDFLRYRDLWADGVNTSDYQVSARDEPGDWNVAYFKSALINASAQARQFLYYHDPGGAGPVLSRVGCGGADAGGGAVWWVVLLRP